MQETSRIIKMEIPRLVAMKHHAVRTDTTLSTLYDTALTWFIDHHTHHDVELLRPPTTGKSVTLPLSQEVISKVNQIASSENTSQIRVIYTGLNLYLSHVLGLFSLGSYEHV